VESNAHSSAPQALRGNALRQALRQALSQAKLHGGTGGQGSTANQDPFSDGAFVARLPRRAVASPAFPEPADVPDSAGPQALRPRELAAWFETHR
jgi:hypothetical protein